MTGGTIIRGASSTKMKRYSVDEEHGWPPRFCKLQLHFADGTEWAFCDSRRFARIRLVKNPTSVPPLSLLGWDPLLSWPSFAEFNAALSKQRRAIKAVLLDQSFSPGVGNWVADEVLYQSRVHPEQPANSLTSQHAQQVHHWVQEVCRVASEAGAEAERLPGSWLFHVRWGKGASTKSKIDGHVIDHITVGGRTSAYVPALQKLVKTAAAAPAAAAAVKKKKSGSGGASEKKRQANDDDGDDDEKNGEDVEETKKKVKRVKRVVEVEVPEALATSLSADKKKKKKESTMEMNNNRTATTAMQQQAPPLSTTTTSRNSKIVRTQRQPSIRRTTTTTTTARGRVFK